MCLCQHIFYFRANGTIYHNTDPHHASTEFVAYDNIIQKV
jgi:hypothetical protein